jgi:hypothetical protein
MSEGDRETGGEKTRRSKSFGEVASTYERFRPGPPPDAIPGDITVDVQYRSEAWRTQLRPDTTQE